MSQWIKSKVVKLYNHFVGSIIVNLQEGVFMPYNNLRYDIRRQQLIEHILYDKESGVSSERYVDHGVIVSLTTYGKRIYDVALTIESIMQQSMKANRIVLYLDNGFHNRPIPQSLINQQKRGLEIEFVEDIRSYKKIIPQLIRTPDDAIITIDDDALYEYDLLEHLIRAYQKHPDMIHCCRANKMELDDNGKLVPYLQWKPQTKIGPSSYNFQTGVGGVLYPPYCLDPEVLNKDVFIAICPDADDIWLKAMALKKGTLVNKVYTHDEYGEDYLLNWGVQDIGLWNSNVDQNGNDMKIKNVFSRYSLYERIL